jgi:hypothetical protein
MTSNRPESDIYMSFKGQYHQPIFNTDLKWTFDVIILSKSAPADAAWTAFILAMNILPQIFYFRLNADYLILILISY